MESSSELGSEGEEGEEPELASSSSSSSSEFRPCCSPRISSSSELSGWIVTSYEFGQLFLGFGFFARFEGVEGELELKRVEAWL